MVIIRISGGLGNQIFQYAAELQIALQYKVPLKLDLRWYKNQTKRNYQLDCFIYQAETPKQKEIEEIK